MIPDPVALTRALIAAPSITPARGAVFDVLEAALLPIGFTVERFIDGFEPDGPVENMLAVRRSVRDSVRGSGGAGHFAFAGHLDVVPPGEGWTTSDPFSPELRGDLLYGRGAVDMKGAIAAFVAAAAATPSAAGTISLIITGDEEGPATFGTRALMKHMEVRAIRPDMMIVGEPTSLHKLGDMVKIGRRGSVNIWIDVPGVQGHVAYPHLADNPVPRLMAMMTAIDALNLDSGNACFQASNIEITNVGVGHAAVNMIPDVARARLSIRFNDSHKGQSLIAQIENVVHRIDPKAKLLGKISGEAFYTPPGKLTSLIASAIRSETGLETEMSTSGGTSDARFLHSLCPVIEFGLTGSTMHKVDEAVCVEDIIQLAAIYRQILAKALSA